MNPNEYGVPFHVVCPSENVAEIAESYNAARALFEHHCPAGARVVNVAGIRENGKLKCAWIVTYIRKDGFQHIPPEELDRRIQNSKPNNTSIIKHFRQYPPGLILIYSIKCGCPVSPSAGIFTNRDGSFVKEFDPVDVKVNLDYLKVEGNE